ncbi:alpha/beta hydrolase [Paucibacter sp. APW11]|uniref:Alpha/beta hydrolase n=1 Tax=Roseateles aquae TaxID=3077235 RepID=A0ABU3PAZ1_9BURK|nr:alpha/beta hydrolase [Paucibacter sp. APW11]MDT8999723.1 alpha/beta hydrolase [Paucibacter sp. APW11]
MSALKRQGLALPALRIAALLLAGATAAWPSWAEAPAFIVTAGAQARTTAKALAAGSQRTPLAGPAGCPDQGGLLNSITVPVGQPLELSVQLGSPAPKGGATFQLRSNDPSVVAAGDPKQAFLPKVFVPEGELLSNTFSIYGIKVGATRLALIGLTPGYGSTSFPLGAWDLNRGGDDKFVDANNPLNHCRAADGSNDLSTDPNRLAQCGITAKGIAADGLSKLLLRSVSGLPGTMCYQITSTSSFDQGKVTQAVLGTQASGALQYGFSYLQAPESFGDTADSREVELEFRFTPNIGNGNTTSFKAKTRIVRPPVVLIHGVWSSGSAWGSDYKKENAYRTTVLGDYAPTNGASFTTNYPRVQDFVSRGLKAARDKGFAVTQADVMGHSMGGLLTRLYVGGDKFKRPDNFGQGDIRRLISVDTPHSGSTFGNLVAALHQANAADADRAVQAITNFAPAGGAVCDLAENSPALAALNGGTSLKVQAITGTGGPAGSPAAPARFFGGVLGMKSIEGELTRKVCLKRDWKFSCVQEAYVFPQATVDAFRFRQANDMIVSLISQQGGSCSGAGLAGFNFPTAKHSGPSLIDGVINLSAAAQRAYQLLDGPASGFADGFPGVASTGLGVACTVPGRGAALDAQDYSAQCAPGGPLKPAAARFGRSSMLAVGGARARQDAGSGVDTRVQLLVGSGVQTVQPGQTLALRVNVDASLPFTDGTISIPGFVTLPGEQFDAGGFQAHFLVPQDYAGPLLLTPSIIDSNGGSIDGPPVLLAVRPASAPLRLSFAQKNQRLTPLAIGTVEALALSGSYPGDIVRDLSSSASGTSYSSSNPAVVSVDSEGLRRVNGTGIAVITASNSGQRDHAVFVVEDSAAPLPAQDQSGQLSIQQSGLRLDRSSGFFVQTITIANTQGTPLPGPLFLLLSGLPSGVDMVNASGRSQRVLPGSPYLSVPLLSDGLSLQPGQSLSFTAQYLNPGRLNFNVLPAVWRSSVGP